MIFNDCCYFSTSFLVLLILIEVTSSGLVTGAAIEKSTIADNNITQNIIKDMFWFVFQV